MSVVPADITISGKVFHIFTILGAKENFLKSPLVCQIIGIRTLMQILTLLQCSDMVPSTLLIRSQHVLTFLKFYDYLQK